MADGLKYFEDFLELQQGESQTIELGSHVFTAEAMVEFARAYDPQAMHTDPAAAARSTFGGLIASGWQTAAVYMRMLVDTVLGQTESIGSPGIDNLRWLKPVRPGDTLRLKTTVIESTPSGKQPNRGTVLFRWDTYNQNGEIVLSMRGRQLFLRRAPARLA